MNKVIIVGCLSGLAFIVGFGLGYIVKDVIVMESNAIDHQWENRIRELMVWQLMEEKSYEVSQK